VGRIPIVPDDKASPRQQLLFEGARTLHGRVANFFRTIAHSPAAAMWLLPFVATTTRFGDETVLSGQLRQLAIVRTSILNSCRY
jgi:hypothetical protein